MKKYSYLVHLILFAVYPVLWIFSYNLDQVIFEETVGAFATVLGFALALWIAVSVWLKQPSKAAILVSGFLVLFFTHGYMVNGVRTLTGIQAGWPLFIFWISLYGWGAFRFIKTPKDPQYFSNLLNVMALALVVSCLIPIIKTYVKPQPVPPYMLQTMAFDPISLYQTQPHFSRMGGGFPDVYYLIFDRYASASTLKKFYGYDNTALMRFLKEKGFYVAEQSKANYFCTTHSLLSSLNMQPINKLKERVGEGNCTWNTLYSFLPKHQVGGFFQSQGYELIHVGSWWRPTRSNPLAQKNINPFPTSDFMILLYRNTPLPLFADQWGLVDFKRPVWEGNQKVFDEIAHIAHNPRPTFTFAHILLPHPPYIFDAQGNYVKEKELAKHSRAENYTQQLAYTNNKIQELVTHLLRNSSPLPIIILQADEGPYPNRYENKLGLDNPNLPWKEVTDEEAQEKAGILNAYYLPNVETERVLYPTISPVNSFRVVLNEYFGTRLPLLPDTTHGFTDMEHPCEFFDVTQRL